GFSTFYFATSALLLIIAVVEASYHMAYQDGLTGLPARRALNEALLRLGSQYTVGMVDVDHFKRINDSHGHDVGDQVLKMVAAKLAQVGGGGRAYRYGGEEFAVLFPGKSAPECLAELEALRQVVEEAKFILRSRIRSKRKKEKILSDRGPGQRVPVTVSIGVAEMHARHRRERGGAELERVLQAGHELVLGVRPRELRPLRPLLTARGAAQIVVAIRDQVGDHVPEAHLGGRRLKAVLLGRHRF